VPIQEDTEQCHRLHRLDCLRTCVWIDILLFVLVYFSTRYSAVRTGLFQHQIFCCSHWSISAPDILLFALVYFSTIFASET